MSDPWSAFGDDARDREGASRGAASRRASAHAFFARDGACAGVDGDVDAVRAAVLDDFDRRRAGEGARTFAPGGAGAADACARARDAARRDDWTSARREARRVIWACAKQLEAGNWPDDGFLDAHTLAHGVVVLAELEGGEDDAGDEEFFTDDPTVSAACRDAGWDRRTRLGRIALDLLAASTLYSPDRVPEWCADAVALVERAFSRGESADATGEKPPLESVIPSALPERGVPTLEPGRAIAVEQASELSTTRFYSDYIAKERPCVIKGHIGADGEDWKLMDDFKTLDLFDKYAETIVPVEYGTAFESHGTGVTTLGAFARDFLVPSNDAHDGLPPSEKVAYISQHPIFNQIPAMQDSFTISPYCLGRIRTETSAINAWLGTAGTKTAIHRDPYLNLLCQIAGHKYVRIYDDAQTKYLYCDDTDVLRAGNRNTFTRSPVDPESAADAREYPLTSHAEYLETILAPGDVLFMPKNHWHYVRSLTTSVSVNFWF